MRKYVLLALAISIPVIIFGCIFTGTVVLPFDLQGGWISNGSLQSRPVDLADNPDYVDNKDKLKSIDAIVIVGDVANLGPTDVTAKVYISDNSYTAPEDVLANATEIFVLPTVPAQDSIHMNWSDASSNMENLSAIEDQVRGDGKFNIYIISSSITGVIYKLNLIVTMTVGK